MASNTNWDKTVPSGSSSVAQGDDDIRSFKSFMQAWWEDEHYGTDGSSSSAGEHKLGSARAYSGGVSSVSTTADSGRLMWTTDARQLYHVGYGSIDTIPSLGTVNTFLSHQSFNAGASFTTLSASTTSGAVAHHDTVIASTVSAPTVTGLSALSVSRVTTDALTVGAANGVTFNGILPASVSISTTTIPPGETSSFTAALSNATLGDVVLGVDYETRTGVGNLYAMATGKIDVDTLGSVAITISNRTTTGNVILDAQTIRAIVGKLT